VSDIAAQHSRSKEKLKRKGLPAGMKTSIAEFPGKESTAGEAFTKNWVEGPPAIQLGNGLIIYFDHFTSPQYYGAVKSSDMKSWQDIPPEVALPKGWRHGTILKVPESIVRNLHETNQTPNREKQND
jgi:hypothetical protein